MNDIKHFYVIAGSDNEKYVLDLVGKAGAKVSVELGEIWGYFVRETGEILNKYYITERDRRKVGDYLRATKYAK